MTNLQENNEDNFVLTFSDIVLLIKKNSRKIYLGTCTVAIIALIYALTRPIQYEAQATFKEKAKSQSGLSKSILSDLLTSDSDESDTLTIMKSRTLLEQLISLQGFQATLTKEELHFPFLPIQTIKDNVLSEYAYFKRMRVPILNHPQVDLQAHNISYDGEIPLEMHLTIVSAEKYTLTDHKDKVIGSGLFNQPFKTPHFTLTIIPTNPTAIVDNKYTLLLNPLVYTAERMAKQFSISQDSTDKNLIKIAFKANDRSQAISTINNFMDVYLAYIRREHQRVSEFQISYLNKRQQEMAVQMATIIQNHANELSNDLTLTGFNNSEQALELLTINHEELKKTFQFNTRDIHRLEHIANSYEPSFEKFTHLNHLNIKPPQAINDQIASIRTLTQQADALNLALKSAPSDTIAFQSSSAEQHDIKLPAHEAKTMLTSINLDTAREIYIGYSRELSQAQSGAVQMRFILSQINDPDFEISSLSTILNDPISAEMIAKASQILLSLKDSENRTAKEQERLKTDLAIQKGFLTTHLQQTLQLLELQQKFIKDKIFNLQTINLSLIEEQIFLIEDQINKYITHTIDDLKREQVLIENSIKEIRQEMASLPKRWATEQLIEQQMQINLHMVEEVTRLVETKNINNNLEQILSAPLDLPVAPINPKAPHLLFLTIAGALIGAFGSIGWVIVNSVIQGVAVSAANLTASGYQVAGQLSPHSKDSLHDRSILDSDLETLRRVTAFISTENTSPQLHSKHLFANTLLLLRSYGPNYVQLLAELLNKQGFKVLTLDLSFDDPIEAQSLGLLQCIEGKTMQPKIVTGPHYDSISSGGLCRYANELIASRTFQALLTKLSTQYDWILAVSKTPLQGAEAESLLKHFPRAIISITSETHQDLQNCLKAANKTASQLAFVFTPPLNAWERSSF